MVSFIVCVDLDRDAPFPVKGISYAVSMPLQEKLTSELREPVSSAVIEGTGKGLSLLIDVLNDLDIPAVFFHEARTLALLKEFYPVVIDQLKTLDIQHGLHGLDHEDFSGNLTGVKLTKVKQEKLIYEGKKLVQDSLDVKINIFRAPYMEPGEHLFDLLVNAGIYQDSSYYKEATAAIAPEITGELVEFPVIRTPKRSAFDGMYTYLWPLFEGNRSLEDVTANYLSLLANSKNQENRSPNTSFISLNLHTWHFAYLVKEKRYFREVEMERKSNEFRKLLLSLKKTGEDFTTFDTLL